MPEDETYMRNRSLMIVSQTTRALVAFAGLFIVTACSQMSHQECLDLDWYATGLTDASAGVPPSSGIEHSRVCGKYAIAFDRDRYNVGYRDGIENYCTKENGYEVGRTGDEYLNVCPAPIENDFLIGWNAGNELWTARDKVSSAEKVRLNAVISRLGPEVRDDRHSREIESLRVPDEQRKQILEGKDGPHFGTGVLPWDHAHTTQVSKIDRLISECVEVQERVAALGFDADNACD